MSSCLVSIYRYQNDVNAPSAASQLRLTTTRDLNINITVSNANMLIQAYASWNNLSQVHEPSSVRVIFWFPWCITIFFSIPGLVSDSFSHVVRITGSNLSII